MKNFDRWEPTKFIVSKNTLKASREPSQVGVGSRLIADIVAKLYYDLIPQYASGRLLDLGCGKVPLYAVYRDYIQDNICVDWGDSLHCNDYLDFECDLSKRLPFSDSEFDTIILSDVLEHIPDPQQLCNEMSRVLSGNGKLLMNVPFYYWIHEKPHDYYRYTEFALRRFMETSGFKILHLSSIGGAPEIICDVVAKNVVHIPMVGTAMAAFIQWLTAAFIGTPVGKRISDSTGRSFPLGYFLVAEKV